MRITNSINSTQLLRIGNRNRTELKFNNSFQNSVNFGSKIPNSNIDKILNNKFAQKVFKFASLNPFGFNIVALTVSCMFLRPATLMVTPGTSKKEREYAAGKSIISSGIANGSRILLCLPLAKAIEKLGDKALHNPNSAKFPAKGTPKFEVVNYAINNGFAVLLSLATSGLMVSMVAKIMPILLKGKMDKNKIQHADAVQLNHNSTAQNKKGDKL
jgi:hypothetical protein